VRLRDACPVRSGDFCVLREQGQEVYRYGWLPLGVSAVRPEPHEEAGESPAAAGPAVALHGGCYTGPASQYSTKARVKCLAVRPG